MERLQSAQRLRELVAKMPGDEYKPTQLEGERNIISKQKECREKKKINMDTLFFWDSIQSGICM